MTDLTPIRKSVTVPVSPKEAFRFFTEDLDRWWPVESHSLSGSNGDNPKKVEVEPRTGGLVLETLPDGTQAPWATVTDWQPGVRFSLDWYVGRDPGDATEVTVVFTRSEGGTRVDLTHDGFERLGLQAAEMCSSYNTGWDHVLGTCYCGAFAAVS